MPKAIVLGGYGLIGSACMRALARSGFDVIGVGRSRKVAETVDAKARWIIQDITTISTLGWHDILTDVDVVVNASGALQDGLVDDLEAIHVTAVSQLAQAATNLPVRVIQISAAGVSEHASTAFFRSKARGDAALMETMQNWVILHPTLLLAPQAYGGTALLRAASAIPLIHPIVLPEAQIQTVYIDDVTAAVVSAAQGDISSGTIADLTETEARSLPELIARIRVWQGWPHPRITIRLPGGCISALGRIADGLGHLGWRSPLRTTALQVLSDGVRGDPQTWENAGGQPCRTLEDALQNLPSTRQERLFARAFLALPVAIGVLALFWLLSGIVALMDPQRAMTVLADRAAPQWLIATSVIGGATADIFLGLAILYRPWTRHAALGMIALSTAYLLGGVILAPDLWADPLGPMIKVFPGMTLAAMVWLMVEDR
ncbi:SDR family oxidoreductase [Tropicibacter sp. Alg240-R139]|uniref:SDR family oxidoreductase n=1 Tax=Tropicibacter sp. Alg240-R139 TaxID=2305991 RepID=UPI0013E087B7|nr:SDR family oxidoreductase [Tropicibacter sp. Alg240-R139]